MRTIEISCLHPEKLKEFRLGRDDKFRSALGYMVTWALGSYNKCDIGINFGRAENDVEILCHYREVSPEGVALRTFTMCGVWRPDTNDFSFHS